MRTAGGYTLQQSLTTEAANIAKQAVSLARRRGHAQVTPLHVATIMFSTSSTCLFRKACLQSHSHPLQSRALELCFNVALNRLQTSTSNSILAPHHGPHLHHLPSLSNALIAAFKRAQAHQRRGSSENQQPVLAVKIDIEQLVISILDDPSVSRVMREAGFSSTQVKTKVELGTSPNIVQCPNPKPLILRNSCVSDDFKFSIIKSADKQAPRNDDVMSVVETLTNKKTRNIVIVGECAITAENVVKGVIEKFDSGNVYDQEMQSLQFISVPLCSLRNITREEFETKLEELRSLVKSLVSRGVVLYLGDLKWACDQRMFSTGGGGGYSAVEHMVVELSRLGRGYGGYNGKLWIMGTATFQTYMKCKNGNPSLEKLWELHAITIPVGCLALGLNLESGLNSNIVKSKEAAEGSNNWLLGKARTELNFNEARNVVTSPKECDSMNTTNYTNSSLPAWLQKYKEDEIKESSHDQENVMINNLGSNPNSTLNFSSASPCSSTSVSSNDSKKNLQNFLNWESNFEDIHSIKEQNFLMDEPKLENKPDLLSNPNSSPNSASSSEAIGEIPFLASRFTEQNQENFDFLSTALEKVVPWQRDAIQETVSTLLKCRSKMKKQDTWLYFTGPDSEGKENIAKELAKVVFGSQDNVITISLSSFSTVDSGGEEVISKKRSRNEEGRSYFERFKDKVKENPSRVFFIEDVEQIDYSSQKGFKKAMNSGSFRLEEDGELVFLKDAIVIFSSDNISSCLSRGSPAPTINVNGSDRLRNSQNCEKVEEIKNSGCPLDLNVAMDECNEDAGFIGYVDNIVVFKV